MNVLTPVKGTEQPVLFPSDRWEYRARDKLDLWQDSLCQIRDEIDRLIEKIRGMRRG